jgi:hypothetical protein
MVTPWLVEEGVPASFSDQMSLERHLDDFISSDLRISPSTQNIAIRLKDLIIHNNKTLLGGSTDVRLDALVLQGNGKKDHLESFYMPQTHRFPEVKNGQNLIDEEGSLLIFYGLPFFFIDISITISRDKRKSDEISKILNDNINSNEISGAVNSLLSLATGVPNAALITTAIGAASRIGTFAYRLLNQITGKSIGFYHACWLESESLGIGRHPKNGVISKENLSFAYEIIDIKR